jgi:hypothetical protein
MKKLFKLLESLGEDYFKLIQHRKRGTFVLKNTSVIDDSNIVEFFDDTEKLAKLFKKNKITRPIKIKGIKEFKCFLGAYKSDYLSETGYTFIDSKTYFTKYREQRIASSSREKLLDNFRYVIMRVHNLADSNFFPFGIATDKEGFILQVYDRGNLSEFCARNLSRYLNKDSVNLTEDDFKKMCTEPVDTITKAELLELIGQIKRYYSNAYPIELDAVLTRIENDKADSTYNLRDIIGSDGIETLLDEVNNFTIVIGDSEVISAELVALNNRNNPWQFINFAYQEILTRTDIAFTTIAKRILAADDYYGVKTRFTSLIDKAPEHILIPHIAYDIFRASKVGFNAEKFANLAFLIEGHGDGIKLIANNYTTLKGEPDFKFDLIDKFYSDKAYDVAKLFEKKLKRLKKVIKAIQSKRSTPATHEVRGIQTSKIDDLLSAKFGFNLFTMMALIFAKDDKTIKHGEVNYLKAIKYFYDTFFGDKVFTVSNTKDEYLIKDPAFLKMLTMTEFGGDSKSHIGRGKYFTSSSKLNEYAELYKEHVSNAGPNDVCLENEIDAMREVTKVTELVWWERLPNGKYECVGYDNDGKVGNASWEHLINETHASCVIRSLGCNKADGAMDKSITNPSDWYTHIAELQVTKPYIKLHGDEDTAMTVSLLLKKFAKYKKQNENNLVKQ